MIAKTQKSAKSQKNYGETNIFSGFASQPACRQGRSKLGFSGLAHRGFTIIEMIITIALMGALVSGIFPLFTKGIALNKKAKNKLIAYQRAQKEIETLRGTNFDSISNSNFSVGELPMGSGQITVDGDFDNDGGDDEIKEVLVTINWQEENATKNVALTTYIAQHGLNKR